MILIPAMRVTTKGKLALSVLNEEKKDFSCQERIKLEEN